MSIDANLPEIRLALSRRAPHSRLFYNPAGLGWAGRLMNASGGVVTLSKATRVEFGLAPGSSDLIGWTSITITPDMVGSTVAVFTSGEVKNPARKWRFEPGQEHWLETVTKAGGFAGVVETDEDALKLVRAG